MGQIKNIKLHIVTDIKMEFPKLKLARSCALSSSNDPIYVLLFATQQQQQQSEEEQPAPGLFAAALSGTNEIKIYSQDTFCCQCSLTGHEGRVTAVKFDRLSPSRVWSSSLDGSLRCWDLGDAKSLQGGTVFSQNDLVGYSALDINCDGTILAAGTEIIETDEKEAKESKRLDIAV